MLGERITQPRLHEDLELLAGDRESIDAKIERAIGQFERGECFSAEESRARLQEQKAAWLAGQRQA